MSAQYIRVYRVHLKCNKIFFQRPNLVSYCKNNQKLYITNSNSVDYLYRLFLYFIIYLTGNYFLFIFFQNMCFNALNSKMFEKIGNSFLF